MSIGTGIKKIGRGFRQVGRGLRAVARLFVKLFLALFGPEALENFRRAARQMLSTELGRIAWAVVEVLSRENLSNEEKRRLAFERIARAARDAGLTVKDSLINLLIEIAVQRLKGLIPRPPATELWRGPADGDAE